MCAAEGPRQQQHWHQHRLRQRQDERFQKKQWVKVGHQKVEKKQWVKEVVYIAIY